MTTFGTRRASALRRSLATLAAAAAVVLLPVAPAEASVMRADGAQLIVATSGTSSAQSPALSPNSATLLFTRYSDGYDGNTGGVFKVGSGGGAVSAVWNKDAATNVNGLASWNAATNRITFAVSPSSSNGDIATVAPSGASSTYKQVTHNASATAAYLEPTYSPDGKTIVFEVDVPDSSSDDGTRGSLYYVSSSGGAVHPLLTSGDDRLPVWSPNGKLILFQRRTDLAGDYHLFTIDPSTHALKQITGLSGTATAGDNCDSDASWSPDGRWILDSACYGNLPPCPGHPAVTEDKIFLVSADGRRVLQVTSTPTVEDGAPAMSPDGRWIYFEAHRTACDDNSPAQVWRIGSPVRSDGAQQVFRATQSSPIAAPEPSAQNPCYEPNSSQLLFTVFTNGYNNPNDTGSAGLFRIPGGGGTPRTVVFHTGQSAVNLPGSCYSAATGRIAYSSDLGTSFSDTDNVWTALPGAANDAEHEVTCYKAPLHAQEPSWSADGKTLVYELDNDNTPNTTTIWTIPATNNCSHPVAPTRIVPAPSSRCPGQMVPPSDNHEPNWSPDGSRILFQSTSSEASSTVNLWTVKPNGCGLTRITNDPNSDTDASWSPDSSSIVYSTDFGSPTGIANLYIVAATAAGAKTRLTSECYYDGAPSWSPDGRWVSFETWADFHGADNDYPTAIWRIPAGARPPAPRC